MEEKCCEVCGTTRGLEEHHVIFRKPAPYLVNCKKNKKFLCGNHHRTGKDSPHQNWEVDLSYKLEFKEFLLQQFNEDRRYTEDEIRKKLGISKDAARSCCKKLKWWHGGYTKEDIIFRALGNSNFWEGMKKSEVVEC
jgi:hypothetical protein